MKNINYLIGQIEQSNLLDQDKNILIKELTKDDVDLDRFIKNLSDHMQIWKRSIKVF